MQNKKSMRILAMLSVAICLGLSGALQAEPPKFEATVLFKGKLENVYVSALNNLGEIVGGWVTPKGKNGGLLIYPNGTTISLPNLTDKACSFLDITDLNDQTQIVGQCNNTAMIYTLSEGIKFLSDTYSVSQAINNKGQIAGQDKGQAAVFLENGTTVFINAGTHAYDINDIYGTDGMGQVVGFTSKGGYASSWLYENGVMTNITHIVCPSQSSDAFNTINNRQEVTGRCSSSCAFPPGGYSCDCPVCSTGCVEGTTGWTCDIKGFIYGAIDENYETFPNWTLVAINDEGWALGDQFTTTEETCLIIDGMVHNLLDLILPTFGITEIYQVIDINDRGQILAVTNLGAVLLTPIR